MTSNNYNVATMSATFKHFGFVSVKFGLAFIM